MLEEIRQLEMPAMKCLLSRPHVQVAGECPADASAAAEGAGLRVQGCERAAAPPCRSRWDRSRISQSSNLLKAVLECPTGIT